MKTSRRDIESKVKRAIAVTLAKKAEPSLTDSLVASLGFNSLRMVSLSLALEEEFSTPLLLNDWIAMSDDPRTLTVGSLCDYIEGILSRGP